MNETILKEILTNVKDTNEKIEKMDDKINGLEKNIKEVREEMSEGFNSVREEMNEGLNSVREEMNEGLNSERKEMNEG